MKSLQRTIKLILDLNSGETIEAEEFFKKSLEEIFKYRYKLEEAIKNHSEPLFICLFCKELLKISGGSFTKSGKQKSFYFEHTRNLHWKCPQKTLFDKKDLKTINRYKYHGQREGKDHIEIKNKISYYLELNQNNNSGISEVIIDKNWKGLNEESDIFKRPDIRCVFNNMNIVFEIQLSTTFLSVIEERQYFYKTNKTFIIWVFKEFHNNDDFRRFTDNDVIFSNNQNAFIFDRETEILSHQRNNLVLKCFYRYYEVNEREIHLTWRKEFVELKDLSYDNECYKVYYKNTDLQRLEAIELQKENIKIFNEKEEYKKRLFYDNQQKLLGLNNILEILTEEINELYIKKQYNFDEIQSAEREINNLNEEIINIHNLDISNDSKRFISKLLNYNSLNWNFREYREVLTMVSDTHKIEFTNLGSEKQRLETLKNEIDENLNNIQQLPQIEINNVKYSQLDKNVYKNEIIKNYHKIKFIYSHSLNSLFVEALDIENEFRLNKLITEKTSIFIYDYSKKINELVETRNSLESKIAEINGRINLFREEIEEQLSIFKSKKRLELEQKINDRKRIILTSIQSTDAVEKQIQIITEKIDSIKKQILEIDPDYLLNHYSMKDGIE